MEENKCKKCNRCGSSEYFILNGKWKCKPCNNRNCIKCNSNDFYFKTNGARRCIVCQRSNCKNYKNKNKSIISDYNKTYKKENRAQIRKYENQYAKINITYKLGKNLRKRIWHTIKTNNSIKDNNTEILLGFKKKILLDWLTFLIKKHNKTNQFNFDNYGEIWHIDHVVPCSIFDLKIKEEQYKCFNWTNLQPLLEKDNISKNNKTDLDEILRQQKYVIEFATINKINLNKYSLPHYMSLKYLN